jgi:hypothetical protein
MPLGSSFPGQSGNRSICSNSKEDIAFGDYYFSDGIKQIYTGNIHCDDILPMLQNPRCYNYNSAANFHKRYAGARKLFQIDLHLLAS